MLHGQTRYHIRSRFFDEIPEPLLRRVNAPPMRGMGSSGNGRRHGAVRRVRRLHRCDVGDDCRATASGWRVGQNVTHPKFGAGVIVNAEGRGADARVQVNFRDSGLKWLALEYAKLSAA